MHDSDGEEVICNGKENTNGNRVAFPPTDLSEKNSRAKEVRNHLDVKKKGEQLDEQKRRILVAQKEERALGIIMQLES